MLDPLGYRDQGQAIGPQRGPNRNAEQKVRGPGGLPALGESEYGRCGTEANRAAQRATQQPLRGIEIGDRQTRARIEEQPLEGYDAGVAFHGGK